MDKQQKSVYEEAIERGYSRRSFIKMCTAMSALLGLKYSAVGQIVEALETKPRIPIIWLHGQECTGCSESFIRSSHPIVADILLDSVSLDYTETLMAASGYQAEEAMEATMKKFKGQYILAVEGAAPIGDNGVYCCIGGKAFKDRVKEAAENALAVVAWGNCASAGGIQKAKPNPTNATPIHKLTKKPVINVQGCPPIPDVMSGVIVHYLTFGRIPELDKHGRPMSFYSRRVHDTCYRRPNYDAGLFVETFDDENAKKGYCLYKVGCKGPVTYNSCGIIKWNEGTSYPIQSGHPCIGCSEANFWDKGPFYERLETFKGFGIEANADKIGLGIAVGTGVGILGHSILTNIRKQKHINMMEEADNNKENKS